MFIYSVVGSVGTFLVITDLQLHARGQHFSASPASADHPEEATTNHHLQATPPGLSACQSRPLPADEE